ncbi:chloroplast ribosomal protein L3 precursor [Klebsormidium nitens]|uniref:Large ribosomal subunit protein uL3c n=1 Tax=Klebsormidium nitens TaxID=105231 RepID=A0A1Y1I0H3_KLENI|nr:chloroplast ribosomal protein L3 precursor [Klebsormidium nitens]|eukprot:GAQ84415.1 chloroplast ribosomal protein L3 precursor [Klebsormidium nitens]
MASSAVLKAGGVVQNCFGARTSSRRDSCPQRLVSAFQGLSVSGRRGQSLGVSNGSKVAMASYEAGVGVYGNKAGMMQVFDAEGNAIPVTVIAFHDGNIVTQVKTPDTDGYSAVQIGYKPPRRLNKPETGHLEKVGAPPLKHLTEFRLSKSAGYEAGQQLDIYSMFNAGDMVDVRGKSIGKGTQGIIKRYNAHRGLMTHGSKSHRQGGTIGPGTSPGRVYPGRKMAGKMGNKFVKIRKLKVIRVDAENKCLLVKGAIPGKPGNLVKVTPAKIVGKNIPPWSEK